MGSAPWDAGPGVVESILDRHARHLVGVAVGVGRGGGTWTFGRGRVGADGPGSPGLDTIFELGSITKVFTATLLASMAGEGIVALDDPANRYLPPGGRLPVRGRPITLLDLATHSSGLPRLPKGILRMSLFRHRDNPYAPFTVAQLERAAAEARLKREPGTRPRYSNFGMGLLGHVLGLAADLPYGTLVRDRICDPLGLVDTRVEVPAGDLGRFADGHDRRGRPVPHWELPSLAGAGALRSTVHDMLRFLELQHGDGPSALARAARATHGARLRRGRIAQCLGWMSLESRDGARLLWHDGGTGGFRSFCAFAPETGAHVVVLSNGTRRVDRIGFRIMEALRREAKISRA